MIQDAPVKDRVHNPLSGEPVAHSWPSGLPQNRFILAKLLKRVYLLGRSLDVVYLNGIKTARFKGPSGSSTLGRVVTSLYYCSTTVVSDDGMAWHGDMISASFLNISFDMQSWPK